MAQTVWSRQHVGLPYIVIWSSSVEHNQKIWHKMWMRLFITFKTNSTCLRVKSNTVLQCTLDISWSCISRNCIYCNRMLAPFFGAQERDIFHEIAVIPWTQFAGDNFFAKSAHRDSLCSHSQETIFHAINSSRPVNVGWNTCCVMVRVARRIIDISIVSHSKV